MAYDQSKDKMVADYGTHECGEAMFHFGLYSYNGGEEKLGITRESTDRFGKPVFGKLGRMTWDEVAFIQEKMFEFISKHEGE